MTPSWRWGTRAATHINCIGKIGPACKVDLHVDTAIHGRVCGNQVQVFIGSAHSCEHSGEFFLKYVSGFDRQFVAIFRLGIPAEAEYYACLTNAVKFLKALSDLRPQLSTRNILGSGITKEQVGHKIRI